MAKLLWGKVYYQDTFAGFLREEPGQVTSFSYDASYLDSGLPAIAYTLPLTDKPYQQLTGTGLFPFFDNLTAEGWLQEVQTRLLGKRQASRFELLLAFGYDLAGAVSVIDPEPAPQGQALLDMSNAKEAALLNSHASLSGIQPKLMLIERDGDLHPAVFGEVSTHIAKFPSRHHDDIVVNEYLSTLACQALLPQEAVVQLTIKELSGFDC